MSAKPKDHRPKVISFRTTLDGLNIAARQSVLWPCHRFNISIQQKKKSGLNVFENTILRITEIESGNTDMIAQLTCLKKELVAFIQNRLNQLGLLTQRHELSYEGKKLLEFRRYSSVENVEYVAGNIFVDLHSGKLIPYIHIGTLKQEKIVSMDGSLITLDIGSTGKSNRQRCRLISPSKDSYWKAVPDSNDIIRAIREFKRKYKRHALLSQSVNQYPPPVPMAEAISLHDNPELIYLHCEALVQIGNSDLLVTDGCGFGFSESISRYLTSNNSPWVTSLKQKGVIEEIGSSDRLADKDSNKTYKYAEISRRIKNSQNSLGKIKDLKPGSSNYERECKREIESGIKNLYASLEWALRQVVADFPVPEWENIFSSQNFRDNEKLLQVFAEKIGFWVTEINQKILQVKAGAIQQIEQGKVELQPLIALCIAGANGNAGHPMHTLAQNHSGFLGFSLKLKKYRDPIEHGSTEDLYLDADILAGLIEDTIPVVTSLVPAVARDLNVESTAYSERDIHQERLKATIELEMNLGSALVLEFSPDIKEQLLRSEMMLAQHTNDKAIEIIKCYASVIQQALYESTNDRKLDSISEGNRDEAIEKIVQSGFYPTADNIPEQISTVNVKRLYRAVQGSSTTLGAHLLAVFLLGSESELIQLRNSSPAFVDFVADLIQLRGHGNKQHHDFSRNDMESLKDNVFKAIKIITEIF